MKTKITLLTAALAPLALAAQAQEGSGSEAPAAAVQFTAAEGGSGAGAGPASGRAGTATEATTPATIQRPARLPRVQFENASLREVIDYIEAKAQEFGLNPDTNPLNVVITPGFGIEDKRLPSVSLRNVSPTEVLTIVTTVLNLQLEAVSGDDGQVVAWLVKGGPPVANTPAGGSEGATETVPGGGDGAAAGGPGAGSTAVRSGGTVSGPGGSGLIAAGTAAIEIASSPATGAGGLAAAEPQKQVKVFGIAQLIASKDANQDVRQKERQQKYMSLIDTLSALTADQTGTSADIKFYEAMEIIVVKTADPTAMTLVAEAIEAMKKNGSANSADSSREQTSAMRAELDALRGQLKISEAERDMTRRTYTDQIEALKAAQKLQNSDRKPER
jgi:hypothetical protein